MPKKKRQLSEAAETSDSVLRQIVIARETSFS